MKRNTVMALLVAVSTTAVSLGPQVPASAKDIECRYDIPRSVKNSVAAPVLPAVIPNYIYKISGVGPANPLHRSFGLARPRWSVVGVRPAAGTDYDAAAERCPDEPIATSANAGSAVEFVALDGVTDRRDKFFAQPRLGDETEDFTFVDRVDDRGKGENGREQNAGGVRAGFLRLDQEIETDHLGHFLVRNDDGEVPLCEDGQRLDRTVAGDDVETLALERFLERGQHHGFVVDDENGRRGGG